ncbi:MAG: patatin-like phospholipase RssA [Gammaproteobacteria bacterium]|nr:patatin-like phospholipase RssA [Gammaproteobacteria bacterium]
MTVPLKHKLKIGLALGSGSARGWAHIGVIQGLAEIGLEPDIVAGSSIGAFVGSAYASNQIDELEEWVSTLTRKEMLNYIDLTVIGGGFIQGEKLFELARKIVKYDTIESLPRRFGVVATDLETGREIWFQNGPLLDAVRASISLPGVFTPAKLNDRWLVDGGLSNPVPVSLCRAMGADVVIAVNLNGDLVGKHIHNHARQTENVENDVNVSEDSLLGRVSSQLKSSLYERKNILLSQFFGDTLNSPGLFDVIASSINIMQDRITRSRMAGDPPEIILSPRLSHLGLMEFDQAAAAIEEGRSCVQQMRPALEQLLEGY